MRSARSLLGRLVAGLAAFPPGAQAASAHQVAQAVDQRRARVEEFRVIKEAAQELGMRVWLFGGTAAGFAHYVRWDLAREAGDPRYRETFFDYDFTNIYRSTQDADLVVDATPEQAERLEALIKRKMSFLQGSKEHWEVRLLRQDRTVGGQVKQALLHNPDFLGQNTDSNSTGMIELTEPPPGEAVVRDLRDWESPEPFFLKDVTEGRLHYYLSPTHQQTSRFRSGDNPPLFSVIRYLVKAFQYDLQVDGEDLAKVRAIIDAFDPERDYAALSPWAKGWLERYGSNLIRHSVNIEHAWETLQSLGLRQKLIALSDPKKEGSLGWWLSREPLRTRAVSEGTGRTAAELGIDIVAHETRDFLAYESITRDTTLRPNVLISRRDFPGEAAVLGPGFYTRLGRTGAAGTGFTIRFRVDPNAREGTDFSVHGDYVLFTNRAALQVIPESLQASWLEYFQMFRDGVIDRGDRGAWMKLKRRLSLRPVTESERAELVELISGEVAALTRERSSDPCDRLKRKRWPLVHEWLTVPLAREHPEILESLAVAGTICPVELRELPDWIDDPRLILGALARNPDTSWDYAIDGVLREDRWKHHPYLGRLSGGRPPLSWRLRQAVDPQARAAGLEYFQALLRITQDPQDPDHRTTWSWQPRLFLRPLDEQEERALLPLITRQVEEFCTARAATPRKLWEKKHRLWPMVREWLALPIAREYPELAAALVERGALTTDQVKELPEWVDDPRLVLGVMRDWAGTDLGDPIIDGLLKRDPWKDHPYLRKIWGGEEPSMWRLRRALGGASYAQAISHLLEELNEASQPDRSGECLEGSGGGLS